MMNIFGSPFLAMATAAAVPNPPQKLGFWATYAPPEDISTNGHLIDWLFTYITIMDIFYFILVCAGLFGFCYLYSAKRHPKPYYTYGNKKKQLLVTLAIGMAVFFSIDLNIARISNNDLVNTFWKWPKEDDPSVHKVEVLAQQWAWNYRLAGADGVFNTEDDVVSLNDLHVPVNTKILFHLTSKDVIHAFFIPNARIKVDAIPGRITRLWVEFTKTGKYEIACAEMCGAHHYLMKSNLTVHSQEDFLAWKKEAQTIALTANDPNNLDQFWGWNWEGK